MQHFSLPLKDFSWAYDLVDLPKHRLTEEDSEWGYIAELDLEFPRKYTTISKITHQRPQKKSLNCPI